MAAAQSGEREAREAGGWEVTGNHYLTFSHIARATGAVHAVNILHRGLLGLVEWNAQREPSAGGDAFLTPFVRVDGEDLPFPSPRWDRLDRWIPTFRT
ncbi:MAG: hypothetical protein ACRELX_18000, partial [Longimicrobiales bacterium]